MREIIYFTDFETANSLSPVKYETFGGREQPNEHNHFCNKFFS